MASTHEQQDVRNGVEPTMEVLLARAEEHRHSNPALALLYAGQALESARRTGAPAAIAAALRTKGCCHARMPGYDNAEHCLSEAMALYEALHDDSARYDTMYHLAVVYERTSRYNDALHLLRLCLAFQPRTGGRIWRFRVLNSLGIMYKNLHNFEQALHYYMQCLHLADGEESADTAKLLLNIGNVLVRSDAVEQALDYYTRARAIAAAVGDDFILHTVLLNVANAHLSLKDYTRALECYAQALDTCEQYGAESRIVVLTGMADIYLAIDDTTQAMTAFTEVVALAEQAGIPRRKVYALASMGHVLCRRGETDRGIPLLMQALELGEAEGNMYYLYHIYRFLAAACETTGDIAAAYAWYKRYSDIREQMTTEQQQKAVAEMQTRFEVERVEHQKEIYRLRTAQLEQELSFRANELVALALRLTEKNELLHTIHNEIVRHRETRDTDGHTLVVRLLSWIEGNLDAEATWTAFEQQFNKLHHGFLHTLSERCPRLTTTELRICSLLKIQLSSKDIANLLSLSRRTVETHRYNIRKKLQLDAPEHLTTFLSSL